MSWDPLWEHVYRSRAWGRYPPEELIRFVARTFGDAADRSDVRILDLGCGSGANLWYLAREGFTVTGVDGSETALRLAAGRLESEGLSADLHVGDFLRLAELDLRPPFDAVIDVASLQQNRLVHVESILGTVRGLLAPGGHVFSMLAARGSWGDGLGREVEPGTFVDIEAGPLRGMGLSHFFTLDELKRLFAGFAEVHIELVTRTMLERTREYTLWVVDAAT